MTITVESTIHFERRGRGSRRRLEKGPVEKPKVTGRVPRVARLMALAIRFEQLIETGDVRDYAELARLAHVSRARITQIMKLLLLAPDIQEAILFLPPTEQGPDRLKLAERQAIALEVEWRKQRRL